MFGIVFKLYLFIYFKLIFYDIKLFWCIDIKNKFYKKLLFEYILNKNYFKNNIYCRTQHPLKSPESHRALLGSEERAAGAWSQHLHSKDFEILPMERSMIACVVKFEYWEWRFFRREYLFIYLFIFVLEDA
jgi:hypothetical protein